VKILQVIQFFNPSKGGSVIFPFNLSRDLVKKGHEVTLLTTDYDFSDSLRFSLEEYGVKIVPIHCQINISEFLYSPSINKWLKYHLPEFDIIHLHNFRTYQNCMVSHFAKRYGIPYIIQSHGDIPIIIEKQKLKKLFDLVWGNKLLKNASLAIANSKTESESLKMIGIMDSKISIIPNGLNLSEFENLPSKNTFKEKYGIRQDEKIILYLGRIHKIKGIDLLVDAFFDLLREMDNIKLVIVGPDAGFLDFLLKKVDSLKIQEKIIFTGRIENFDKQAAYVDAEVYVLPSVYECFPLTVLEAWACGTPTILSEGCIFSDCLFNKNVIFKQNRKELKDLMKKILLDNELKMTLRAEGEQLIKNQFNWEQIINDYIHVYSDLIIKDNNA
jgi:glycosyltransferase involved in cell wall biosynthesis